MEKDKKKEILAEMEAFEYKNNLNFMTHDGYFANRIKRFPQQKKWRFWPLILFCELLIFLAFEFLVGSAFFAIAQATVKPIIEYVPYSSTWQVAFASSDIRAYTVKQIILQATAAHVDVGAALRIAKCESDYDPNAQNRFSTAKGVYQFTDATWKTIKATKSQFNPDYNIAQFMRWYPVHPEWWKCK